MGNINPIWVRIEDQQDIFSLYLHIHICMGVSSYNISRGCWIHIMNNRIMCNLKTSVTSFSYLPISQGRSVEKTWKQLEYLQIIIKNPSYLLKHKTCWCGKIYVCGSSQAPDQQCGLACLFPSVWQLLTIWPTTSEKNEVVIQHQFEVGVTWLCK